ncbi:MAG TPA: hypothetical protein VM182_01290 [Terriglobia bacterium]|nr:hypothetical protein [Terriglobia bacterium]
MDINSEEVVKAIEKISTRPTAALDTRSTDQELAECVIKAAKAGDEGARDVLKALRVGKLRAAWSALRLSEER